MRTFDLSPLYKTTVGFDRLANLLDQGTFENANGYPPYNIERLGENDYRITMAVSGFSGDERSGRIQRLPRRCHVGSQSSP